MQVEPLRGEYRDHGRRGAIEQQQYRFAWPNAGLLKSGGEFFSLLVKRPGTHLSIGTVR